MEIDSTLPDCLRLQASEKAYTHLRPIIQDMGVIGLRRAASAGARGAHRIGSFSAVFRLATNNMDLAVRVIGAGKCKSDEKDEIEADDYVSSLVPVVGEAGLEQLVAHSREDKIVVSKFVDGPTLAELTSKDLLAITHSAIRQTLKVTLRARSLYVGCEGTPANWIYSGAMPTPVTAVDLGILRNSPPEEAFIEALIEPHLKEGLPKSRYIIARTVLLKCVTVSKKFYSNHGAIRKRLLGLMDRYDQRLQELIAKKGRVT